MNCFIKSSIIILLILWCCKKEKPSEPSDTISPSVEIVSPPNNTFVGYATNENAGGSNVKLKIVAVDNESGIDRVEVYMDGILKGIAMHSFGDNYEYVLDLFSIEDGKKINVYVKAYDKAGNANISESREYYVLNWKYQIDTIYVATQSWDFFYVPAKIGDSVKIYLTLLNTTWNNKIDSIEVWDGDKRVASSGPVVEWEAKGRCAFGEIWVYIYNNGIIYEDEVEKETGLKPY